MTDTDKIEELSRLSFIATKTLELAAYKIQDEDSGFNVIRKVNSFYKKGLNIIKKQMTDADKVLALTELLGDVIHVLELKQYDIEDPQLSHECVTDADKFHQRMMDILYPKSNDSGGG